MIMIWHSLTQQLIAGNVESAVPCGSLGSALDRLSRDRLIETGTTTRWRNANNFKQVENLRFNLSLSWSPGI